MTPEEAIKRVKITLREIEEHGWRLDADTFGEIFLVRANPSEADEGRSFGTVVPSALPGWRHDRRIR